MNFLVDESVGRRSGPVAPTVVVPIFITFITNILMGRKGESSASAA